MAARRAWVIWWYRGIGLSGSIERIKGTSSYIYNYVTI